jgi:hypothetical protein
LFSKAPTTCGGLLATDRCECQPAAVTAGDLAFLRALYSMDLRENLFLETGAIQNAMMREFKRK